MEMKVALQNTFGFNKLNSYYQIPPGLVSDINFIVR